ncbi:MAG: RNA methyltransferase [Bacteroidota bacterium]
MKELPEDFLAQIKKDIPHEEEAFKTALQRTAPTSVRYNSEKVTSPDTSLEAVVWNASGRYLPQRPIFTLDPAFHAGAYYVQEASSMFVGTALRQHTEPNQALTVLDLCAAPGGKSTLLLDTLNSDSLLVSNEVISSRYRILQENLRKWGSPNVAITNHDPKDFQDLEEFFDVILIDAPCSGEGLFRRDEKAIAEWSLNHVALCGARQQRIFRDALPLLKSDGLLIYCTCTYNSTENMDNVAWLTNQYSLQSLSVDVAERWSIAEKQEQNCFGYQFYPHRVKGEGFFLSIFKKLAVNTPSIFVGKKFKKQRTNFRSLKRISREKLLALGNWVNNIFQFDFYETTSETVLALPKHLVPAFLQLDKALKRKQFGIPIGKFKRNNFIPSYHLALSTIIHPNLPTIEVNRKEALLFLKKEKMNIQPTQRGWLLVQYKGLNLGWIKVIPGRINNYLPKELRIRMDIE